MDCTFRRLFDGLQRSGGEPGGVDDDSSQRGADSVCSIGALLFFLCFGRSGILRSDGLFMAGVSVPCAFLRLLPKWVIVLGMILAVTGELSWFHLVSPKTLFLIPLVRFPGFIWLIAVGFALPKTRSASVDVSAM